MIDKRNEKCYNKVGEIYSPTFYINDDGLLRSEPQKKRRYRYGKEVRTDK